MHKAWLIHILATMLVRSGIGKIRLIDFDQVTLSSLNVRNLSAPPDFTDLASLPASLGSKPLGRRYLESFSLRFPFLPLSALGDRRSGQSAVLFT